MLLRIIRFFKGWVRFGISGMSPERFLNLTSQRGIILWEAHPSKNGIEACMTVKDYRMIRPIARRARVRTRILEKRGLPFIAAKYKGRVGIPIGAAVGIALLVFLSQFIWTVDIKGAEHISETRIRAILNESGVRTGAYKQSVNTRQAYRSVLLQIDEISWLSVNITGCHADVEIREKAEKPDIDGKSTPCNLKARADGVVTKVTAGEGIAQVKAGSGVAKGDLLVSGMNLTKNNKVRCVRARGEVFADVVYNKEMELPKEYNYISLTENKTDRFRFSFLGMGIPCSLSFISYPEAVYTVDESLLTANGVSLPLGVITETSHELHSQKLCPNEKTARRVFDNALMLFEIFEKGGAKRVSRAVSVTEDSGSFDCSASFVFNENIAESVDFSVEE